MASVLGLDAKMFRGLTSTGAAETEVTNVKDITVSLESGEADVTTRATKGWKATEATLKDASVEFVMLYDTSDLDFKAFKDAYFENEVIPLFISDGKGTGLLADFSITGFSVEQPLEEAMTVSVTAKPTDTTAERAPKWIVGTGYTGPVGEG